MNQNVYKYDEMKRTQHMAVRNAAGWYCFTHQLVEVTGEDAAAVLDRVYTGPISSLKVGRNKYTLMLNEQGKIIDDVIVIRLGEEKFWVSNLNLYLTLGTLGAAKADGARLEFAPLSYSVDMYSVQGPKSRELVNRLVDEPVDDLKFFSITDRKINGIPVKINRAGFTGEKMGYELYIPREHADTLVELLRSNGAAVGATEVTELQLMCWTLPTEKGLLLMRDMLDLTPMDAGLERYVDWSKDFTGKEALLAIKDQEPSWEILGFTLDEDDAFIPSRHYGGPGAQVLLGEEEIGRVAKFVYSYVLEKNIGYVMVERGRVKPGDHVTLRHVDSYDAVLCDRVFC